MKSNIVAGSNVFLSREDDPRWDPEFIAQIQDYEKLKEIEKQKQIDRRITKFKPFQTEILRTELRCIYAKNDPCWGYSKRHGRVISRCINGDCPKIHECNPAFSAEEAEYWAASAEETDLYGSPDSLRRYYFVDMVSDEEMSRYCSVSQIESLEYSIMKNPVLPNEQDKKDKQEIYKIDEKTGKKMVVVGYRWAITDNASYENEELIPIWGFVEEIEEQAEANSIRKKAKRIEKKKEDKPKKSRIGKVLPSRLNSDYERKEEFEKAVADNLSGEIKLTDDELELFEEEDTLILLDNPAELAFVSLTLLTAGIGHGILTGRGLRLALIEDCSLINDKQYVLISNTVLKNGCRESSVQSWKNLSEKKDIILLQVAERDYYKFPVGEKEYRWTCRNMQGVTHVCVNKEDISELNRLQDGEYPVTLADNNQASYSILTKSGDLLGYLGKPFVNTINALIKAEEIPGIPALINGLSLLVQKGTVEFLGMGHLKFIEY